MIELTPLQVLFAYLFLVVLIFILKYRGIKKEKLLIISSLRMTIQLIIMGYLLIWLFEHPHPLLSLAMLFVMFSFAIMTVFRKFKGQLNQQFKIRIAIFFFICGLPVLFYFLYVIISIKPYYNPQYVIPIAGMLIGNSMTGVTLSIHALLNGLYKQQEMIETHLILGATPKEATKDLTNHAFDQAMMPTINSMLGMGIIFLPGMMTGQILAGINPSSAILYQIAIMMGILGSVTLTSYMILNFGVSTFFNQENQLMSYNKAK
jgi:putative ABC transport system permease protein